MNATIPITVEYHEIPDNIYPVIRDQSYDELQKLGQDPSIYKYISVGMKSAVRAGFGNNNDRILDVAANCPGGNCTFNGYSSVAVCASYVDVSEHLETVKRTINKKDGS